jgi:drug/metabolite transporter (DMT)-like permease
MSGLRTELSRIIGWEDHHKKLVRRLTIAFGLTLIIDALGTVAIYFAERKPDGSEITSLGDALFFTTVQLLTVSSQIANPFTTWGRVVDVVLELWAVIVVAGVAGAMASFFLTLDEPAQEPQS